MPGVYEAVCHSVTAHTVRPPFLRHLQHLQPQYHHIYSTTTYVSSAHTVRPPFLRHLQHLQPQYHYI
jgi:hypothetical protein